MTNIPEETSKRITSLRFLLMLFVMIKHNAIVKGIFMHQLPFYEPGIVTFIKEFFANGLGELAVPVFFIFSGYLLAASSNSYFTILKKRFHSIFLPYTIWTFLYFAGWVLLKHFHFTYGNPVSGWREWSFIDYFVRFIGYYHNLRFPFVGSFWFLRDLMILIVISPILIFVAKRLPFLLTVMCSFFYFCSISIPLVLPVSLFFFVFGILCSIYKIDFFRLADKIKWHELIFLFLAAFVLFKLKPSYNIYGDIKNTSYFFIFIFSGIFLLFKFSLIIINNEKAFSLAKKAAPFTFFTYAFHTPILLEVVKQVTFRITLVEKYGGAVRSLSQFIIACILDIGISLAAGILLYKICPAIFNLLSGGKRNR